jgi:hypothetical protein
MMAMLHCPLPLIKTLCLLVLGVPVVHLMCITSMFYTLYNKIEHNSPLPLYYDQKSKMIVTHNEFCMNPKHFYLLLR